MAKKDSNPLIIVIIIVVVLFFISPQQEPACVDDGSIVTCGDLQGVFGVSTRDTQSSCNDRRDEKDDEGKCVSPCEEWTLDIMYCADYWTKVEGSSSSYIQPYRVGRWFFQYEDSCPAYTSIREEELWQCARGLQSMPNHPACIVYANCDNDEFCNLDTLTCQTGSSTCGNGICDPFPLDQFCSQDCTCSPSGCDASQSCIPNCQDSDGGLNYDVAGFAVEEAESGTCGHSYNNDYCSNNIRLFEGYCDGDDKKFIGYDCPNGCLNGRCFNPSCNTAADTNCDGIVNRAELGVAISQWISGTMNRDDLGQAIMAWSGG